MPQFEFCNCSPQGEELDCSFGEWTGWHCDGSTGVSSNDHNVLELPAKEEDAISPPRAQAIGRCRKEMMELVSDVPEDAFELSLKDIVELPTMAKESTQKVNPKIQDEGKVKKVQRKHCKSQSVESAGFLLKMFFPVPSSSSSGKKKNGSQNCGRSGLGGSSRSGSNSTKPLMEDGRKAGAGKSSEGKLAVKPQHGALGRNCSRSSLMTKGSANIFLRTICNNFKY